MARLGISAALLFLAAVPASAQGPAPAAGTRHFESWRPAVQFDAAPAPEATRVTQVSPDRTRRTLIGGAIGAAAGVVFCTTMSTLINDSADGGLSFCPLGSYLLIGGAGFALGALVGWLT